MSGPVEVFLDETPGETRGAILRNGRFTHLLIQRESDVAQTRLGARSIGRVVEVNPGLRGAFVDLGAGAPAFLPFNRNDRLTQGQRLAGVVSAESRFGKGAVGRRLGSGEGAPRLIQKAPSVADQLRALAPGEESVVGIAAIDAVTEAEEEALARTHLFPAHGLDLSLERTRALIAIDIDHAPTPGRDSNQGRVAANREGLNQAARLIGLRRWGGLVVVDLIGDGRDAATQSDAARIAFSDEPQAVFGPVSRFGLLELSLPWRHTPLEDVLLDADGRPSLQTRALSFARRLRRHLLSDTASPRIVARCTPEEAAVVAPLAERLGPRAGVRPDAAVAAGRGHIEET